MNLTDSDYLKNYMNDIMVMVGVFTQDAIRLAGMYCSHSGRTSVTKRDVELALKTRAFHNDEFWNRDGIQQKFVEMKKFLDKPESESESESESELEDSEMEIDETHFTRSECKCEICNVLNGIEEKWDTWNPTDRNSMSIKMSVDNTFSGQEEIESDGDEI